MPAARAPGILTSARAVLAKEAAESPDTWQAAHESRIAALLTKHGDED
ncbi:hypothetical protein [Streptomyces sp. NPDC008139]